MNTILITNAISSLLATAGIGAYLLRKHRRFSREIVVRRAYVTTDRGGPLHRRVGG